MAEPSIFSDIPPGETITAIEPLRSDPNVRRIRVGKRIAARLPAREIEALGLMVGQRWTAEVAARVGDALAAAKARKDALNMLGKRAMSRREVIERLERRGHAERIAQRIADHLKEERWIDDEAYAIALAEELVRRKKASRAMVIERMMKRGVDEALAAEVTGRVLGGVDPVDAACEVARKRLEGMARAKPQAAARRVAAYLARRGFDEETITEALRRAGLEVE